MTSLVLLFVVVLAAANGSNDVPKGVATLAGAGVTRYRNAILWGTLATFAGSLASIQFADRLTKLFSKGIVTAEPTTAFALAILVGTSAWVLLATLARLPVSTTHALIGALIGAGLVLDPEAVNSGAIVPRLVQPLLLGVFVAYLLSAALNVFARRIPECICVDLAPAPAPVVHQPSGLMLTAPGRVALPRVAAGRAADCSAHPTRAGRRFVFHVNGAHWLSSGAASFARGLNDTPKLVAVGAFSLVPAGMTSGQIVLVVAGAMAAGSLIGGMRVARRLGDDVVAMSHLEGFKANLVTALLVGAAANRGLPMSTTQVSIGAIAGIAGRDVSRLNGRSMRDFLLAWLATPLTCGLIAAGVLSVLG